MVTWFGNQKTATKLMMGFAFTGAIMAGLVGVGLNTAGVMRDNIKNVNNVQLKPLMEITELRGMVHQVRSWVIQAVLTRDSADRQQALTKIEEIKTKTDELRKNFEQSIVSPQLKKAYEEFVVALSEYRAVREGQVLKLVIAGNQDEALVVMKGEGARKYKAVVESINNLVAIKRQIAQDKYENSLATFMTAQNVMIASCVGGIALSLLFGWLVARFMARNLGNVLVTAQALGGGNLSARSSVMTQDEIGTLANAFNQMGDALQKASGEQQTIMQQAKAQAAEINGITDAISKAQAVIEFTLDGSVVTANENFLNCLGYRLDEIKGQHHRTFCDQAYVNSAEYADFWRKLGRGEYAPGIYRRLRKDGKEVWFQAAYNPILDANGKPYKVIKYATDVTAQKQATLEAEGILKAVDRGQALIEFGMDGTVRNANAIFLNVLGYGLNEIKGQHHRMFCEPVFATSQEYTEFWKKLNDGEFHAGTYKRLGKGGTETWIQATYNPIFDLKGKPYKVVKFATDITGQKRAAMEMEQLVKDAEGVLGRLASNDLTQEMSGAYSGDLEKIKASINAVVHNLTQTITVVRDAVELVMSGSEQITKGNEDLSQRTSEQAGALEETSASMEEMTSTVKQNADNAKQANQLAIAARDTADKGGAVTKKAVDAMGEINQSSKQIADIITVIDEIAFQTNLLALNAAVEAARAGEHGRGFAVVAAEVRNLAQRSATAAKEIKGLINESIQRVTDGSELVHQSGKTLEEIVTAVKRVTDIIAEITAASQEQASGIDQVNKAIVSMDETTQQNAALVEETTSAAQSMKEQAKELMRQMEAFKIKQLDSQPVSHSAIKPTTHSNGSKAAAKRPVREARHTASDEIRNLAAVTTGTGKNYRAKEAEFEEF